MALSAFSKRILEVKPSPTVGLNARASALIKAGRPVISFAVGEPDFPTPRLVVEEAIASLHKGRTKYGAAGGGIELRTAISAKLLRENKMQFPPEQIVLGTGAKEILFHLMLSLLNEGDEVLIPSPYWVSYADQVIAAGGIPVVLPLPKKFPHVVIDLDLIEKHATDRTVAIILNSPNNPSGYVIGESAYRELGKFLARKTWWIISDEIYEYMAFDLPHFSLLHFNPELQDRFVLVNGFSKSFAMTGWRVGYCAGPRELMKLVQSLQSHSSTCLPGFVEDAALVAIKQGRSLVEDNISTLKSLRKIAVDSFKKVKGVSFVEPQGAFYLFADLRNLLQNKNKKTWANSMECCEWLLSEFNVAVVPGEAFGAPGFFRLSYAVAEKSLIEGISRLRTALGSCSS